MKIENIYIYRPVQRYKRQDSQRGKFWQCGIDGPVGGADIDWLNGGICVICGTGTMKLI
jgi:hypothetical protein